MMAMISPGDAGPPPDADIFRWESAARDKILV